MYKMASGEELSKIDEVIEEEREAKEKNSSKLKRIKKRCRGLLKRRPNGDPSSERYIINRRDKERRSKLAEDALFYDDMLEVSHLQDRREPKESERSKIKNRLSRALSINSSPVASCVCLRYSPNKEDSGSSPSTQSKSRELKKEEILVPDEGESSNFGERSPGPDGTMLIFNRFHALNSISLSSSQQRGSQFPSILSEPDQRQNSNSFLSLLLLSDNSQAKKPAGPVHSQVDYTNFLIPGLREIINCPFYWGKIDRYEAESRLHNKPEGSFLLRDSAQDEFVFSVSFRRYSRSLHARIEEDNHMFSFDSHDPGVHSSPSIRKLLEYYKDPLSCMFFEPMLLFPVVRKTCFSLQTLARATICDHTTYAGILGLPMPTVLKNYLREYHYRHKIRTRYLESIA